MSSRHPLRLLGWLRRGILKQTLAIITIESFRLRVVGLLLLVLVARLADLDLWFLLLSVRFRVGVSNVGWPEELVC